MARLLLTYVRLVEGRRLRQRKQEFWPEHKVGRGKKAFIIHLSASVERTRQLGVLECGVPVPQGGSERGTRRMARAIDRDRDRDRDR
eukprot:scaffold114793_cov21-Phaeocystis_antarctica.AAC.1